MPPDSEIIGGNTLGFGNNHHQRWLWECWQDALAEVEGTALGDPFCLLVNGDATEGIHHRSPEVVASLIEHDVESYLARLLNAEDGKARDKWLIEIGGCLVDAAHHIGATSRTYLEASLLSIVLGNARLNAVRAGHPPAQVFLRAHRHCGGVYSDGSGMMCVTGGWQFLTRHGHKVVGDAIPRPSVLILDWRGKPEGALPTPHHIYFNPPAPQVVKA
jgi:hypothetical protein